MHGTIVIYKSRYGGAKQYAKWISEAISADCFPAELFKPSDFARYDTVIFGGGLYAGSINGIKLLEKNLGLLEGKHLIVFSVGLADMTEQGTLEHIETHLPPGVRQKAKLFCFRSGIDYSKLGFMHKAMMGMMKKMLSKKSPQERTEQDEGIIATYGKKVDFSDKESIKPLIEYIKTPR